MTVQYCLYDVKATSTRLIIKKNEYDELVNAKSKLQAFLYIEEKLNIVLENYLELEQELLNISFSNLVTPFTNIKWEQYVNEIHKINRRIINLLTTTRMYLDHIGHDIKQISNKIDIEVMLKKLKSEEYDSKLGYRVMEALRNYVQHRGLPIHVISHKQSNDGEGRIKHVIMPVIRVADLESDGNFKKSVLNELKKQGERVDVRQFIREYIQSFYLFQKFIRDIFNEEVLSYVDVFNNYYSLYESKYGKAESLVVSELIHDEFHTNRVHIIFDIVKRRNWLENKNNVDKDLTRNFVSGEL